MRAALELATHLARRVQRADAPLER